jgi:hypothetical protein
MCADVADVHVCVFEQCLHVCVAEVGFSEVI